MKIRITENKLFAILCILIALASCTDNSIYRKGKRIAPEGWNKDSTVQFVAPIVDTINEFDIYINIRNTNEYPLQNLFVFVQTTSPLGNSVVDTLNLLIADDYGRWTGKSVSRIWENDFLYRRNVKFASRGNYTFTIQQGMRNDILTGISDVSIEIKPVE
ncbi:MAG: gliding motility lipoprotein GldH [Prevotellaceae bacterium]|jgi:gliding motility-associated lipoprotein GldH|nr:gliding motility lipoprotein GldH [Prevotellaceae bacterium]